MLLHLHYLCVGVSTVQCSHYADTMRAYCLYCNLIITLHDSHPPLKALKRAQGLCLGLNFLSLRKEQGLVDHGRLGGIFIEAHCQTKEQRIEEVCDKVRETAGAIDYMGRSTSKYIS